MGEEPGAAGLLLATASGATCVRYPVALTSKWGDLSMGRGLPQLQLPTAGELQARGRGEGPFSAEIQPHLLWQPAVHPQGAVLFARLRGWLSPRSVICLQTSGWGVWFPFTLPAFQNPDFPLHKLPFNYKRDTCRGCINVLKDSSQGTF